jgi:hypothetical protein
MNRYTPTSIRSNLVAALFTIVFSATCLIGAVGPAHAAGLVITGTVVSIN